MTTTMTEYDVRLALAQQQNSGTTRKQVRAADIVIAAVKFLNSDNSYVDHVEMGLWGNSENIASKFASVRKVIRGNETLNDKMFVAHSSDAGLFFVKMPAKAEPESKS